MTHNPSTPVRPLTATLGSLKSLPATDTMPVVFIGHGSPMNAIEDNAFTKSWRELGKSIPKPHTIVVISAHWVTTHGSFITAAPKLETIYDFYGFPETLYQVQYPSPGNPTLAKDLCAAYTRLELDHAWGLDHGAWSILKQMYPEADIPVLQLSLNYSLTPQQEFELMQELRELRRHGILFIGSGNIVHNLGVMRWDNTPYDWALEFDAKSRDLLVDRNIPALLNYHRLGAAAELSIPTDEHYRPMLAALALSEPADTLRFFNEAFTFSSVSMRSFILE